ncbi:Esterase FE4 [Blattella germanica]|nr:Esterase FE4 [Blattella germanica]
MKVSSMREQDFFAFLGVPYAKPPIGELRFKAPQQPDPWTEIYDANDERNICPQIGLLSGKVEGNEDCLFLNIFTPNLTVKSYNDLMPVMIWIHGGNFVTGSGTSIMFGPDHLLTENVILVTINYRLGLLGFLCLREVDIPGNNGLKDQVMAMHWVKKNIMKFGGDPSRVTIFGQSAGAASVHLHMMSPMTYGLFHRAIAQSGTGLASWAFGEPEYITAAAFIIGSKIGCNFTKAKELHECFKAKPALDFVNVTAFEVETGLPSVEMKPTWEDGSSSEPVFLPGKPIDLIQARKFQVVPFITGINSKEALTFLEITKMPNFWDKFDKNFDKVVDMAAGKESPKSKGVSDKIKSYYFKDKKPSAETEDNFVDCYSDLSFFIGVDRAVKIQSITSTAPIYYYWFGFDGEFGVAKRAVKLQKEGVAHADELGYLFSTAISPPLTEGTDEMKTMNRMIKMWTNFAKTGNPTSEMNSDLNIQWQPTTRNNPVYLEIGKELSMKRDLLKERADLWKEALDPI